MFSDDESEKGLAKWVNNRHSDALYADAAQPIGDYTFPAEAFKVTGSEFVKDPKGPRGKSYKDYTVKFTASESSIEVKSRKLRLLEFKESSLVHVPLEK